MIQVFRGIRYAEATRFGQPELADFQPDDRQPVAAPQPPQYGFSYLPMTLDDDVETGEDCLRLSIYTPDTTGRRPVLVWIHGGAFVGGSGLDEAYNGTALAEEGDIVVVCISYRLGALGFLYEPDRGIQNLGIADQTVALQWIRRYIVQFGGDPQHITVAGQSAGAFSIACLIASLQENLFQKAVMMSMPFLPIPARLMTRVDRLWRKQLNADPATASVHKLVRAQLSAGRLSHLPLPFAPCGYHPFRPQRIMPGLREALVMSTADDAYPFCPSPSLVPLVTQVVFNHPIQGYSDRLKRLGVAVQQDTLRWLHGTSEFGDAHGIDFTLLFSQWQHWKDLPLYRTVSEEEYNRHARRLRQRILSLVKG